MHRLTTLTNNVGRRLQVWRYPSRLCFAPRGPRPVPSLNPPLTRGQHIAPSQAPPLPSRPQQDVQQPQPPVKESETPPQDTKSNVGDNHAAPAQEVPQESVQTEMADGRDARPATLPFICNECGSKFRRQTGLHDHHRHYGQAGRCKDKLPIAGMKVGSTFANTGAGRDVLLSSSYEIHCIVSLTHSFEQNYR